MVLPIVKNATMKLTIIGLFLICGMSITGCLRTQPKVKETRVWWGSREEVCSFLNSPEAKSERWFVQALGE